VTATSRDAGRSLPVEVADGVTLHVRHHPAAGGRPFLLVHGLGSNARIWDPVARRLAAAGHPAYAVDLRGHGGSDAPAAGYDTGTAAADLAAAGAALGLTGAVVAGHSWGGNVAVRLAAGRHPLVAALALVDGGWVDLTTVVGSWDECARVHQVLRGPAQRTTVESMREYLRAARPDWSAEAIEAGLGDLRTEPDGTVAPRPAPDQFLAYVRSLWDEPPAGDWGGVAVPTLLLPALPAGAGATAATVRDWVAAAQAGLPGATTRWYVGVDHHLQVQRPDEVTADLLDLARGLGRPDH
jgi:pimeloyl-ACP methyl ester carboxylesterase